MIFSCSLSRKLYGSQTRASPRRRIERVLSEDPSGTIGNEQPKVAFGEAKKVPSSRKEAVVYRSQAWLQDKNQKNLK